jgi:hypothetical protein
MEERALQASPAELRELLNSVSVAQAVGLLRGLQGATTLERKLLLRRVRAELEEGGRAAKKGRRDDKAPPPPAPFSPTSPVRGAFIKFMHEIFSDEHDAPNAACTIGIVPRIKAVHCDWFIGQLQNILPGDAYFDAAAYKAMPATSSQARDVTATLLNRLLGPKTWFHDILVVRYGDGTMCEEERQRYGFSSEVVARLT